MTNISSDIKIRKMKNYMSSKRNKASLQPAIYLAINKALNSVPDTRQQDYTDKGHRYKMSSSFSIKQMSNVAAWREMALRAGWRSRPHRKRT